LESVGEILKRRRGARPIYSKHEYQAYGYRLAEELGDTKHKSLYIKLARDSDRGMLEQALEFVKSRSAKSKAKLFMWKLKELRSLRNGRF
jgi:hypothetical protein